MGEDAITLTGVLYPEITGGKLNLAMIRYMAETGKAWPLMQGTGDYFGLYIIESVEESGSLFFSDGTARKIEFTLKLTRVDDDVPDMVGSATPELMAML